MKHEEALSLGLRPGTQPSTDAREALEHAEDNADTANLQEPAGLAGGGKGALPYDSHVQHSSRLKKGKSKSASIPPSDTPIIVHTSDADGVSGHILSTEQTITKCIVLLDRKSIAIVSRPPTTLWSVAIIRSASYNG